MFALRRESTRTARAIMGKFEGSSSNDLSRRHAESSLFLLNLLKDTGKVYENRVEDN